MYKAAIGRRSSDTTFVSFYRKALVSAKPVLSITNECIPVVLVLVSTL